MCPGAAVLGDSKLFGRQLLPNAGEQEAKSCGENTEAGKTGRTAATTRLNSQIDV